MNGREPRREGDAASDSMIDSNNDLIAMEAYNVLFVTVCESTHVFGIAWSELRRESES